MKARAQFEIAPGEIGPVLTHRLEPVDARNGTDREIPGGHYVAIRIERRELVIVADLGKRGDKRC